MAGLEHQHMSFVALPDELLLHVFAQLDIPELASLSRTCQRLRTLAIDPLLHVQRLRASSTMLSLRLSNRPALHEIQPPTAAIYLTRTHLAARRLHWSLVCIRLRRSLSRRPALTALVGANVIPQECCRRDRISGDFFTIPRSGYGIVVEKKRRLEREQVKQGLRVWMERKAREIGKRRKDYAGVGTLIWRFSRRAKGDDGDVPSTTRDAQKRDLEVNLEKGRVLGLMTYWESLGGHCVKACSPCA